MRSNLHIRFLAILLLLFAFSANTLALYSYNRAAVIESGCFVQAVPANDDDGAGKTCHSKKLTLLYTAGTSIRTHNTIPDHRDAIKLLQPGRTDTNWIHGWLWRTDFPVSAVLRPCFLVVCQHFRI